MAIAQKSQRLSCLFCAVFGKGVAALCKLVIPWLYLQTQFFNKRFPILARKATLLLVVGS